MALSFAIINTFFFQSFSSGYQTQTTALSRDRQSDGGVFKETSFYKQLNNDTLSIPNRSTSRFPLCFLADEAFPLRADLMRPYPGRGLDNRTFIFICRLSRERRTTEIAFGILVSRWRILGDPTLCGDLPLCEKVSKPQPVSTASFAWTTPINGYSDSDENGNIRRGAWCSEFAYGEPVLYRPNRRADLLTILSHIQELSRGSKPWCACC